MKKRSKKASREHQVLIGLVELYLKTGRPVGSNTLREEGFEDLSSATIRNYFAGLEKDGFLLQPHTSGGRIPTEQAFRLYAEEALAHPEISPSEEELLSPLREVDTKSLTTYLHRAAELLSTTTGYATFLSQVRFDHDFISDVKLVAIDHTRLLAILVTDFGQILTEELSLDKKVSIFTQKRLEHYFQWRLAGQKEGEKPAHLPLNEEALASRLYNELMVRYLVRYSYYSDEDVYKTGLSLLLNYPEFKDPLALSAGLALFENFSELRLLLNDCIRSGKMGFWIGSDLFPYAAKADSCSVLAIPYKIGQMSVGAIALLGPVRMPYKTLFGSLELTSSLLSRVLTENFYKYKLSFRAPRQPTSANLPDKHVLVDQKTHKLIESKEKK